MSIRTVNSTKQDEETPRHPLTDELSPFAYGPQAKPAKLFEAQPSHPNLAIVISLSEKVDADGVPLRATPHLVGRRCQHWAPDGRRTGTCRFGCDAA